MTRCGDYRRDTVEKVGTWRQDNPTKDHYEEAYSQPSLCNM